MQENPTKHLIQMKVVNLDWSYTDSKNEFGAKELQLDNKTFGFCNLVGFMVTIHKWYHWK